jgi:type VII secretion integral membrane protein EccD
LLIMGTEICRVSVHVDGGQADIALPADIPVGQLIPSLYDILSDSGAPLVRSLTQHPPTCLCQPGRPPLDPAMTLSQLGIRDGSLLLLAPTAVDPVPVQVVYAADAVEQVARPQQPSPERARLAALLVVIVMAAIVGFVAVPDGVGAPSLLLGAAAVAGAAAISARASQYGRTALMALSCLCTLATAAALAATLFDIRGPGAGLALTVASVSILTMPGRLSVMLSGLSRHVEGDLDPDSAGVTGQVWARAERAQDVLTALVVGASFAAALGIAAATLTTDPGWPGFAAAGLIAAVLVLRSRSHAEPFKRAVLLGCGICCIAVLLVGLRLREPGLAVSICVVAAVLAAGAIWLGFDPPAAAGSAAVRRCLDLLDCVALVCVIPLACWSSGVFSAVRGMSL